MYHKLKNRIALEQQQKKEANIGIKVIRFDSVVLLYPRKIISLLFFTLILTHNNFPPFFVYFLK